MDTGNLQKWCCIPTSIRVRLLYDQEKKNAVCYTTVYLVSLYVEKTALGSIEEDMFFFVETDASHKS